MLLSDRLERASHVLARGFAGELQALGTSVPVWRVLAALAERPGRTVGGGAVVSAARFLPTGLTYLRVGANATIAQYFPGEVEKFAHWPTRLSDAALQALTAP